jgi:aminomethyltransferase
MIGFELEERAVPRQGYRIVAQGTTVGTVSSGLLSPTLNRPIGMGFVPPALATVDTPLVVDVRGREVPGRVVRRPFYKRQKPV